MLWFIGGGLVKMKDWQFWGLIGFMLFSLSMIVNSFIFLMFGTFNILISILLLILEGKSDKLKRDIERLKFEMVYLELSQIRKILLNSKKGVKKK